MKVTRPPGRDPACNALSNTSTNAPKVNGSNGTQATLGGAAVQGLQAAKGVAEVR